VNPCQEFFKICAGDEVARLLQARSDAAAWEELTASEHSPGPVQNSELVIRLVYHPIHVDAETGDLKPSVIAEASSWGCSVQREVHCPVERAWKLGEDLARARSEANPGSPRKVHAIAVLEVAKLRSLITEGKRALGVYDTALLENSAHADIYVIVAGKKEGRSVRAQLFEWARQGIRGMPAGFDEPIAGR